MDISTPASFLPSAARELTPRELTPREQARRAEDAAKLQTARDVLKSMASSRKDKRAEANAAAKQKVEMLKQRLKMLQMSNIGNPKGMAKQIAALAKELAAAVKSYVASGGSAADAGTPSTTPATGDAAEKTENIDTSAETTAQTAPEDDAAEPKNPYDKAINTLNEQAAKVQKVSVEKQEDDAFAADVKLLAKKLKALLAQAKAQTTEKKDPETEEADKAVETLEKELADLEKDMQSAVPATGTTVSITA